MIRKKPRIARLRRRMCFGAFFLGLFMIFLSNSAALAQYDGFTEPYLSISLASSESGVISSVNVRVGDRVKAGQVLVELEKDIQQANLKIAEQAIRGRGPVDLARAERELQKHRLKKLETLLAEGHARQEEVERTKADLAIAEAKLESAEEDLAMKKREYDRAKLLLDRRSIRAPQDGVVGEILKDPGEFIAANDPVILNLAQVDPLLAAFNMPSSQANQLKPGKKAFLVFSVDRQTAEGSVETISPLTDAESGTTQVKIRIENSEGRYRSGEHCQWDLSPKSDYQEKMLPSKEKAGNP
jgi:RND family efflux transporter MFP subunit